MRTMVRVETVRFRFRVAPHPVFADEYPEDYYKFRNEKVAKAFWNYTCGTEVGQRDLIKDGIMIHHNQN